MINYSFLFNNNYNMNYLDKQIDHIKKITNYLEILSKLKSLDSDTIINKFTDIQNNLKEK